MSMLQSVSAAADRPRLPAPRGFAAFLAVGVVGLAVNLGVMWALERAGLPMRGALAISLVVATGVTWWLNRRHTFAASGRPAHHEAMRYVAVAAAAQSVNYVSALAIAGLLRGAPHLAVLVLSVTPRLPHVLDMMAAFAGAVIATLFSYTGQRWFTFADTGRGEAA